MRRPPCSPHHGCR